MISTRLIAALAALAIGGAVLSACREEEQGRRLSMEKGTYQGAPDTPLSDNTRRALRSRASHMR